MTASKSQTNHPLAASTVLLDIGLYSNDSPLRAALLAKAKSDSSWAVLDACHEMTNTQWDDALQQVLAAKLSLSL